MFPCLSYASAVQNILAFPPSPGFKSIFCAQEIVGKFPLYVLQLRKKNQNVEYASLISCRVLWKASTQLLVLRGRLHTLIMVGHNLQPVASNETDKFSHTLLPWRSRYLLLHYYSPLFHLLRRQECPHPLPFEETIGNSHLEN